MSSQYAQNEGLGMRQATKGGDWKHRILRFDLERLALAMRNVAGEMDRQGFGRYQILRLRSMAAEVTDWAGNIDNTEGVVR